MVNIAVFVSGNGTNLQALIKAEKDGKIKNGRISLVISSNPEAYGLQRAAKAGIPSRIVERKEFLTAASYADALSNLLKMYDIGLVVLAGFLPVLPTEFCCKYPNKIINVHPSLIPSFCGKGNYGLKVHEAALKKGVKVSGATVHFVSEVIDGGMIIAQKAVNVEDDDTPKTLQRRVMEQAEWLLLPRVVADFCAGRLEIQGTRVIRKTTGGKNL